MRPIVEHCMLFANWADASGVPQVGHQGFVTVRSVLFCWGRCRFPSSHFEVGVFSKMCLGIANHFRHHQQE
jgi:hypothetical protein